ncbi:hypothetical protein ACCT09_29400, partial [Rhizobium ruizarguesonis]
MRSKACSPKGYPIPHFVKRIPADLRKRLVGRTLVIPFANDTMDSRSHAVREHPDFTSHCQAAPPLLRTQDTFEPAQYPLEALEGRR